ncbi:MAG: hypothetical protein A2086_16185 [Spirochaetes bacterium GWD1_27_9]|nr:MAG: hypothetical protein A2Z98_13615 [Spirochaetes bacterium GWB1_27_13]OHD27602.1 MAG: hypothetical protein A2Y34_18245 [Spirochaetes bacterium GWC1_27_15]OHD38267.1 MAG: hypothetical protein A2086_16185 [Spirochaetes bacterium GWD1_27_9]
MIMRKIIWIFLIFFGCGINTGEPVISIQSDTKITRGLYVNKFDTIVGNSFEEDALLTFCNKNNINYLILYDLYKLFDKKDILEAFIKKAKENYKIKEIAACGGDKIFADKIVNFNLTSIYKFDVLNLEYEYWNTASYTNRPFVDFIDTLSYYKDIGIKNNLKTEVYLGWITAYEAEEIKKNVDRILLHCYVTAPTIGFNYTKERLEYFKDFPDIHIIFSGEPEFCGNYIKTNSLQAIEDIYNEDLTKSTIDIKINWFCYFAYTYLKN